jgi:RNA polymerase sigma-70 factor, ECF subfamily
MRNPEIRSESVPRQWLNRLVSPADQKGEGTPEEHKEQLVSLFDELRVPVFCYLRRIGLNREDSEEIVQEAFLRLFRRLGENGREDNLRGWVYRVARNLAIDRYKRPNRLTPKSAQEWVDLGDLLIDQTLNPEELLIKKEKIAMLNRAICSLSLRQWQCLFLRVEGLAYREIGERLGMKISTVAESLHRAIEKLQCNEMKLPGEKEFGARSEISIAEGEVEWDKLKNIVSVERVKRRMK